MNDKRESMIITSLVSGNKVALLVCDSLVFLVCWPFLAAPSLVTRC